MHAIEEFVSKRQIPARTCGGRPFGQGMLDKVSGCNIVIYFRMYKLCLYKAIFVRLLSYILYFLKSLNTSLSIYIDKLVFKL